MSSFLAALLFVSPVFGMSYQVDPSLMMSSPTAAMDLSVYAAAAAATEAETPPQNDVAAAMQRRAKLGKVHKWLGISTWTAMTASVVFGIIQYRNLYGFFDGRDDNPCALGNAVPSQSACSGRPIYHTVTTGITSALYYTSFALSLGMPDPIGLDQGDSKSAKRLRQHKRLRWAHFGGMAAQILLGIVAGSGQAFGLDRANNYGALQAISTAHLLIGAATYGTLTWSGAIMLK